MIEMIVARLKIDVCNRVFIREYSGCKIAKEGIYSEQCAYASIILNIEEIALGRGFTQHSRYIHFHKAISLSFEVETTVASPFEFQI